MPFQIVVGNCVWCPQLRTKINNFFFIKFGSGISHANLRHKVVHFEGEFDATLIETQQTVVGATGGQQD